MARGLLIDTVKKEYREVEAAELDAFYDLIKCRSIDIVQRRIGRRTYEIVCDDEGLFSDDPLISAVDYNLKMMLCGNLIIFGKADCNGELTDLSDRAIEHIKRHIHTVPTRLHPDGLLMIVGCLY